LVDAKMKRLSVSHTIFNVGQHVSYHNILMNSEANISKGNGCLAEAEKALSRTSFMSVFGVRDSKKFEDAADAFNRAGNFFKLANDFLKAAAAYKKASENWLQSGDNKSDALNALVESATCYKKGGELIRAVKMFEKAIEMYSDGSRIGMAARYQKEVAEIFEQDRNFPLAIESYKRAAELFNHDNKKSNANQALLKAATFLSESGEASQIQEAAKIFEDIGKDSLSSRLGAFSAKNYFFQALVCYLALADPIQVSRKLEQYSSDDHTFPSSRECDLITKLNKVNCRFRRIFSYLINIFRQAVEAYDLETFEGACADFDRITPLDGWKINLLLRAKQPILDAMGTESGVGDGGDDVDLS
jgi:alpha-soluble NSF attachment protein